MSIDSRAVDPEALFACKGAAFKPEAQKQEGASDNKDQKKLSIVASFYPMYDFAKRIAGFTTNHREYCGDQTLLNNRKAMMIK